MNGLSSGEIPITSPLNADIRIETNNIRGGQIPSGDVIPYFIHVGNTGLTIVPIYYENARTPIWEMHFTPEGAEKKVEGYSEKYSEIYAYALHHLLLWWEDPNQSPEIARPLCLEGSTNYIMKRHSQKLLGEEIFETKELSLDHFHTRLYMGKLAENKSVRKSLEEKSNLCESKSYTMVPELHRKTY